jgi:hypothetical protein
MLNVKAKDQQRDIASIGLKTVIAEIPVLTASTISTHVTTIITTKMLEGASNKVLFFSSSLFTWPML